MSTLVCFGIGMRSGFWLCLVFGKSGERVFHVFVLVYGGFWVMLMVFYCFECVVVCWVVFGDGCF